MRFGEGCLNVPSPLDSIASSVEGGMFLSTEQDIVLGVTTLKFTDKV